MNEYYFYAQLSGEIPNTVSQIVIGQMHPSPFEDKIIIGSAKISVSQILSINAIPATAVKELYDYLYDTVRNCPDPTSKTCMEQLKKTVKSYFELSKEPSYVIISNSPVFGKTIKIIFTQGLE